jgi:signal transduction histidine kinase
MAELRRVIYDLRPAKLKDLGLVEAIEHWLREATNGRDIEGKLVVTGEQRLLGGASEACLYRVAKEATSNIIKHSGARSFEVSIDFRPFAVVLTVTDDGCGFDLDTARDQALHNGSVGLHSIAERVRAEGGELEISSTADKGTYICVELPL